MIIETVFTAESKKERKALQMMHINMQDAGMDVSFQDEVVNGAPARLLVRESRRKRTSAGVYQQEQRG